MSTNPQPIQPSFNLQLALSEDQRINLIPKKLPVNAEYVFTQSAVKSWSKARIHAWLRRETHPDAYYYRFVDPNQYQTNGKFSNVEHKAFIHQLKLFDQLGYTGSSWGMFSVGVPNKAGYQCCAYYKRLILLRKIKDPAFTIKGGKLVLVDKARRGKPAPAYLSDAWKDPKVLELAKQVDLWVSQFHHVSLKGPLKLDDFTNSSVLSPSLNCSNVESSFKVEWIDHREDLSLLSSSASPEYKTSTFKPNNKVLLPVDQGPTPSRDSAHLTFQTQNLGSSELPSHRTTLELNPPDPTTLKALEAETLDSFHFDPHHHCEVVSNRSSDDFLSPKPQVSPSPGRLLRSAAVTKGFKSLAARNRAPTKIQPVHKKTLQTDLSFFWKGVKPPPIRAPEPEIVKIPEIVPPTWAHLIRPLSYLSSGEALNNVVRVEDILSLKVHDLRRLLHPGVDFLEGILIDPPWPQVGLASFISSFNGLLGELCSLVRCGLVFVWVPKDLQFKIFKLLTSLGLRYVENLVWCEVTLENQLATFGSQFLRQSKCILLIFKKGEEVEIRHQRSADVVFDFVKPESSWSTRNQTCPKPVAVYEMIEILLPKANLADLSEPRRLLELWYQDTEWSVPRPNWIHVHQLIDSTHPSL